jgi:hypothetical protein
MFDHFQVVESTSSPSKMQKPLKLCRTLVLGSDLRYIFQHAFHMIQGGFDPRLYFGLLKLPLHLSAQVQSPFGFGTQLP